MDLDEPSQYILQYKSTVVYYMYSIKMCGEGKMNRAGVFTLMRGVYK